MSVSEPRAGARPDRRVVRDYIDGDGVAWHVQERQAADREFALYFENGGAFRRVTHYPRDWSQLPSAELEVLSRGT